MSIVSSVIIMVILSLIAISFARIMRQEQQQAHDRQLNTQAYYAAETAINDVRQEINQKLVARQQANVTVNFEGWTRAATDIITLDNNVNPSTSNRNNFGRSMAFSRQFLVISEVPATTALDPIIHIFRRQTNGSWQEVFKIHENGSNSNDVVTDLDNGVVGVEHYPTYGTFGQALAINYDDNMIAVGDPDNNRVIIFTKDSTAFGWELNTQLTHDRPALDGYGYSLAFSGDQLIVGVHDTTLAPWDLRPNPTLHIYDRNTTTNDWDLAQTFDGAPCYNDEFGTESILASREIIRTYTSQYCGSEQARVQTRRRGAPTYIAANDFAFAFTAADNLTHTYRRDGNVWKPWLPMPIEVFASGVALSPDSPDSGDLFVAVSRLDSRDTAGDSTLFDQDRLEIYRYKANAWVTLSQIDVEPLVQDLPSATQSNFGNYGSSIAFRSGHELAIGGTALLEDISQAGGKGAVVFHRYVLPITSQSLLDDQEECIVDSGPLSERFLDDEETVEYTCVLINTRPNFLVYDKISTERSLVVHLQPVDVNTGADKELTDLYVWWEATDPKKPFPDPGFEIFPRNPDPVFPHIGSSGWNREAPVLQFQLIPMPNGIYNRQYLREHTKTFYLYPSTGDSLAIWEGTAETDSGEILEGYCHRESRPFHNTVGTQNVSSRRHCGVRITDLEQQDPTGTHKTYVMRLLSIYGPSAVTIEGFHNMDVVVFKDIQVVVDATARAGHVLRRIQERLPLVYVYDYPEYVLDIAEDICKDIESEPNSITQRQVENINPHPISAAIPSCNFF